MDSPAEPDYAPTPRTVPSRKRDRARYDAATVHAILDSDFVCHLGFVRDGAPVVLPTVYARVDDRLYLHGSTGSRPVLAAADGGLPVCVTVSRTDALVLARSWVNHSLNYRSVVVHGVAEAVADPDEATAALAALLDHMLPGRAADSRPPTARELAMTTVLRVDLREVSAKVRSHGVVDAAEDMALPHWAGLVPLTRRLGPPRPDPALSDDVDLPGYLRDRAVPDSDRR
ncbi:pyridoxamine 5'-phosphate oxidase family protein [Thermobifida halotolerans]|uniref:Pyridoxamine 5'-phosphate oxidase family protein n=1 Tax=Thermobifida halotolerans TaxID=483545 RepID=A0AA97M518_9ACTN|nr:pyridoxamine 5'-phosphate oxidase family protein [Thermobifida halotolerans]UOE20552.1 pyridoxamine 5'-phosphate oxidase family protein [Thermobifida halotolerans]